MNDETHRLAAPTGRALVPQGAQELAYGYYPQNEWEEVGEKIDLRSIWASIYRNKWLIISLVSIGVIAGVVIALMTPPSYRATTSIQIDQQTARILDSEDIEPTVPSQEAERFLQTQLDVLESSSLARQVAQDLNLAQNPSALAAIGVKQPEGEDAEPVTLDEIGKALGASLALSLPRNTRVAEIHIETRDPHVSAAIANAYAENFIRSNLQRRFDTSAYSREFLQGQLTETKQRLEQSERDMLAYAREARLIDASTGITGTSGVEGPRSLTTSNLIELNQAYAQARAARVQAQQRWGQAQRAPAMSLPEVLSNPTIQQLTQTRATLQAQYEEETQRRRAEHPEVMQLAARIREIEGQINSLSASIRNSIREQYEVAAAQEQALASNVGQLKGATFEEQDRSVRYNILRREVDTARQLYEGLLQRFREVSAAAGITANNIAVIDRASVPTDPVWPKPVLNVALGGAGALALALLLVFAREHWDDSVHRPDEVETKLGLPLLGIIPKLKKGESAEAAMEDPRSGLSEAYSALRTALELSSDEGLPRSVMVTSSRQGEGKSTSSYGLARDLALAGKSVLLVDADLRKPTLHRRLNLDNHVGLSSLLARQSSLRDSVQETSVENLYSMTSGPLPPNPAQLLGASSLRSHLEKLMEVFDMIIVDAPPVLGLSDSLRLSSAVAGIIFVIEADGAHRGAARGALGRLSKARANILGAVLTKYDPRKSGYGYEYSYYNYDYGLSKTKHVGLIGGRSEQEEAQGA